MKEYLFVIAVLLVNITGSVSAKETLKDYSFVHGVCHGISRDQVVTVGHWLPKFCENTNDLVDVISFHDSLENRSRVEATYTMAEEFSNSPSASMLVLDDH